MAAKKTIIKRTTRTTNTETRWVFFEPAPPPPVVIPQDVQPILPHRQMASERP